MRVPMPACLSRGGRPCVIEPVASGEVAVTSATTVNAQFAEHGSHPVGRRESDRAEGDTNKHASRFETEFGGQISDGEGPCCAFSIDCTHKAATAFRCRRLGIEEVGAGAGRVRSRRCLLAINQHACCSTSVSTSCSSPRLSCRKIVSWCYAIKGWIDGG